MKTEKTPADCLREVMEVMKKFKLLGIPLDCSEVAELRGHFDNYVRNGECWNGSINFLAFGRIADVNLPRSATKPIEVTLRISRLGARQ